MLTPASSHFEIPSEALRGREVGIQRDPGETANFELLVVIRMTHEDAAALLVELLSAVRA